jgi:hypothetical protein
MGSISCVPQRARFCTIVLHYALRSLRYRFWVNILTCGFSLVRFVSLEEWSLLRLCIEGNRKQREDLICRIYTIILVQAKQSLWRASYISHSQFRQIKRHPELDSGSRNGTVLSVISIDIVYRFVSGVCTWSGIYRHHVYACATKDPEMSSRWHKISSKVRGWYLYVWWCSSSSASAKDLRWWILNLKSRTISHTWWTCVEYREVHVDWSTKLYGLHMKKTGEQ